MSTAVYQIGRSPFKPVKSFLAVAVGDEQIVLDGQVNKPRVSLVSEKEFRDGNQD